MSKVLFVEDEPAIRDVVLDWLEAQQFLVEHVDTGQEALDRLRLYQYDVIVLDWNLPDQSGIEILREFRSLGGTTPVLMLTGRREIDEKEAGLDAGADDYLTKPFHMKELTARIRALLRRPRQMVADTLKARDLELDPVSRKATKSGCVIVLLPREFALLEFFMRNPHQVFSSEALMDRVWSADSEASPAAVRINITRLRSKIDTKGQPSFFTTLHGVGYRFDP